MLVRSDIKRNISFSLVLWCFTKPAIHLRLIELMKSFDDKAFLTCILHAQLGAAAAGATRALARPLFFRENNFFYQIKRFNSLAKMIVHKDTLDSLSVMHIANEFVKLQPERQNIFGTFSEQDL